MLRRIPGSIVCLLFLFVCLAVQVSGQVNTASLTGLVTDPQGAVVPGAVVKVETDARGRCGESEGRSREGGTGSGPEGTA